MQPPELVFLARLRLEPVDDMGVEGLRLPGELDAGRFDPRPQLLAERLKLLPRLADLAHADVLLVAEADVTRAALRGPFA